MKKSVMTTLIAGSLFTTVALAGHYNPQQADDIIYGSNGLQHKSTQQMAQWRNADPSMGITDTDTNNR